MVRISVLYPNEPGKRPRSNSSASTRSPDPPAGVRIIQKDAKVCKPYTSAFNGRDGILSSSASACHSPPARTGRRSASLLSFCPTLLPPRRCETE
jgi:hypothetical protein